MRLSKIVMAIAIVMLVSSCHRAEETRQITQDVELESAKGNVSEAGPAASPVSSDTTAEPAPGQEQLEPRQSPPVVDWDKKIIKTANINVEVEDFKAFDVSLHNSVKRFGAYVAGEQQNQQEGRLENVVTIKVPAGTFEDLINSLPTRGVKVNQKQIATNDVTAEVVDTKARTDAKRQVREQYMELLRKAKSMKDIMEVQREINGIQEDIEAGTQRAKYLTTEAAYSTINLTYYQLLTTAPTDQDAVSFAMRMKEAFLRGASMLSGLLVFILSLWPFFLVAALAWISYKRVSANRVKVESKQD